VETLRVTINGCEGDRQNDLKHHGGPSRAVCLMSLDVMQELQDQGHPISGGTTGENLLISGIAWNELNVGSFIQTGEVTLRITSDAPPCKTIKTSFLDGKFKALSHKMMPQKTRWYAEVIREGVLHQGESIRIE
jgi:MOSC domain-containing protein YiiM